jgi:site-specific DNA recombinase
MSRCVIYCRVSTAGQEDGTSLTTQEQACAAWAKERGIPVISVEREVWSGADRHRPGLDSAVRLLEEGDIFLAYSLDRVSRSQVDTAIIVDRVESAGATFELVTENFEQSAVGTFLRGAKAFAAEVEREKIMERTTRGRQAKMRGQPENGVAPRPLGSQWVPYGLRWAEETETKGGITRLMKRKFEPDPDTIEILRSIFCWYDEGSSLRSITKRLVDSGLKPPGFKSSGSPHWHAMTLRRILANENYIGVGYANTRDCRKKRGGNERPREEWISLPEGTYPKVVDEALFARVQERLQRNKTECAPGNRNPEIGLLRRGVGVCGYCGRSLNIAINHGRPYYRCAPENRDRLGCGLYSMSVTRLDDEVWTFIRNLFQRPGALEAKLFGEPLPDPTAVTLPLAQAEVTRLTQERDRVHRRLRATDDDGLAASYEDDLKRILAEIRAAETRCQALLAEHEAWKIAQDQRSKVLDEAAQLRDELDGLDFHGRRNILLRIRAKIELFRERDADPRWRITTGFVVGRHYSIASNRPLVPSSFEIDVPLTIVFGGEDAREAVTIADMTDQERAASRRRDLVGDQPVSPVNTGAQSLTELQLTRSCKWRELGGPSASSAVSNADCNDKARLAAAAVLALAAAIQVAPPSRLYSRVSVTLSLDAPLPRSTGAANVAPIAHQLFSRVGSPASSKLEVQDAVSA